MLSKDDELNSELKKDSSGHFCSRHEKWPVNTVTVQLIVSYTHTAMSVSWMGQSLIMNAFLLMRFISLPRQIDAHEAIPLSDTD